MFLVIPLNFYCEELLSNDSGLGQTTVFSMMSVAVSSFIRLQEKWGKQALSRG